MTIERPTFIYDRLYDKIPFTDADLKLFQTKEITRLRQVSLSAVPPWTIPIGSCSSRAEHSIGVMHLASIVGQKEEFREIAFNLKCAALAHDIGSPPFSHLSERFLKKILGKSHEEFAEDVLDGSEFAKEAQRQGSDMDVVLRLINGNLKPYSDLLNGTIDIDNLDNTIRYGLSAGLLNDKHYMPDKLAQAYTIYNGQIALLPGYQSQLQGWEECRNVVYQYIYSVYNLSSSAMIHRALDFAQREGELPREYFSMTDYEAFNYLLTHCNPRTQAIMESAQTWRFYPAVVNINTTEPSQKLSKVADNPDQRAIIADEIANSLGIAPENVCVYLGKTKGYRKIHLPILDEQNNDQEHQPISQQTWVAQVYIHPDRLDKAKKAANIFQELLEV